MAEAPKIETPAESAHELFQTYARAADVEASEMLAKIVGACPGGQDELAVSATISGAIMALVRYYASAGRIMGASVTPYAIISKFTPCLHRSAEAYARELIVDKLDG